MDPINQTQTQTTPTNCDSQHQKEEQIESLIQRAFSVVDCHFQNLTWPNLQLGSSLHTSQIPQKKMLFSSVTFNDKEYYNLENLITSLGLIEFKWHDFIDSEAKEIRDHIKENYDKLLGKRTHDHKETLITLLSEGQFHQKALHASKRALKSMGVQTSKIVKIKTYSTEGLNKHPLRFTLHATDEKGHTAKVVLEYWKQGHEMSFNLVHIFDKPSMGKAFEDLEDENNHIWLIEYNKTSKPLKAKLSLNYSGLDPNDYYLVQNYNSGIRNIAAIRSGETQKELKHEEEISLGQLIDEQEARMNHTLKELRYAANEIERMAQEKPEYSLALNVLEQSIYQLTQEQNIIFNSMIALSSELVRSVYDIHKSNLSKYYDAKLKVSEDFKVIPALWYDFDGNKIEIQTAVSKVNGKWTMTLFNRDGHFELHTHSGSFYTLLTKVVKKNQGIGAAKLLIKDLNPNRTSENILSLDIYDPLQLMIDKAERVAGTASLFSLGLLFFKLRGAALLASYAIGTATTTVAAMASINRLVKDMKSHRNMSLTDILIAVSSLSFIGSASSRFLASAKNMANRHTLEKIAHVLEKTALHSGTASLGTTLVEGIILINKLIKDPDLRTEATLKLVFSVTLFALAYNVGRPESKPIFTKRNTKKPETQTTQNLNPETVNQNLTPQPESQKPTPQPESQKPTPQPEPQKPTPQPEPQKPAPQPEPQKPAPQPEPQKPAPQPIPVSKGEAIPIEIYRLLRRIKETVTFEFKKSRETKVEKAPYKRENAKGFGATIREFELQDGKKFSLGFRAEKKQQGDKEEIFMDVNNNNVKAAYSDIKDLPTDDPDIVSLQLTLKPEGKQTTQIRIGQSKSINLTENPNQNFHILLADAEIFLIQIHPDKGIVQVHKIKKTKLFQNYPVSKSKKKDSEAQTVTDEKANLESTLESKVKTEKDRNTERKPEEDSIDLPKTVVTTAPTRKPMNRSQIFQEAIDGSPNPKLFYEIQERLAKSRGDALKVKAELKEEFKKLNLPFNRRVENIFNTAKNKLIENTCKNIIQHAQNWAYKRVALETTTFWQDVKTLLNLKHPHQNHLSMLRDNELNHIIRASINQKLPAEMEGMAFKRVLANPPESIFGKPRPRVIK